MSTLSHHRLSYTDQVDVTVAARFRNARVLLGRLLASSARKCSKVARGGLAASE